MLSVEDVRTANKQCISIPKKEELPPSSLQHHCSGPSLLYPAELAQGSLLHTTHPWPSPEHGMCSTFAVSWAPDYPFLLRQSAFTGRTGGSIPPVWPTRRSRQPRRKQEDVFMLPRGRRDLNPHASAMRQPALHHPALVVPSTGAVPGIFLFKEKSSGMLALPAPGISCTPASYFWTSVPTTPLQPSAECHDWSFHLLLCTCTLWATQNCPFRHTCAMLYVSLAERVSIEARGSHSLCCQLPASAEYWSAAQQN